MTKVFSNFPAFHWIQSINPAGGSTLTYSVAETVTNFALNCPGMSNCKGKNNPLPLKLLQALQTTFPQLIKCTITFVAYLHAFTVI